MKLRTKQFALRIINLVASLPNTRTANAIGNQLVRSGASVGANYRAACRAKSKADFLHKLAIVEEEADESAYWLELLAEAGFVSSKRLESLRIEANELVAIIVAASITTLNRGKSEIRNRKSEL